MEIREDLLHHIWKYRLFQTPLLDLDDLPVELVDPGLHNRDSGPDFFNARIRSGGILWAGNVEIHKKASEWYRHGHHLDPAFDNVILHAVLSPDCRVYNSRGREIQTVKLEIPPETRLRYRELMGIRSPVYRTDPVCMRLWMERLLVERYEERFTRILEELRRCEGDWDEVFFRSLARAFGQHINTQPFEMLARSVSLKTILRSCPGRTAKEALLFGQSGMLGQDLPGAAPGQAGIIPAGRINPAGPETTEDDYFTELSQRYRFLMQKLDLQPISGFLWKFLRLRPVNFPTIRIAQFASSLEHYEDLFRRLPDHPDPLEFLMKMEFRASEYWTTHYRFLRMSPPKEKSMGSNRMRGLFMNAILPFLHASSRMRGIPAHEPDIPGILARIPPEDNRIIRMWRSLGMEVPDGFSSQALLQLTNKYCNFKNCLSCYAGHQIIQSSPPEK